MLINQLRWYKTTDPSWTNLFMLGLSSCLSLTAASLFSRASSPSNFVPRSEVGSVSACRAAEGQHDMIYRNNTINHVYIFHGKGRTKMNLWIYMIWYWMLLKSIGFGIAVNCLHALRVLMLVWALFRRASSLLHDDEVLHLTIIGVSPALQVHNSWPFYVALASWPGMAFTQGQAMGFCTIDLLPRFRGWSYMGNVVTV